MPNYSYCMNCLNPKTMAEISERLCSSCKTAADQADEYARKEGLDVGATRNAALAALAPGNMHGKHPVMDLERLRSSSMAAREATERGSLMDPRRGQQ